MHCDHCDAGDEQMPGWKHEVRAADAQGTVEHLWWAIFPKYGFRFAAGVSVKRSPSDHFFGHPLIVFKLRRKEGSSVVEGNASSVVAGAVRMVGDGYESELFSMVTTWARNLKTTPAKLEAFRLAVEERERRKDEPYESPF